MSKTASEIRPRTMTTPAQIRQFHADFAIAKAAYGAAKTYLDHEENHARIVEGMRLTASGALACGSALTRIKDAENWRENFSTWEAVCAALGMSSRHARRLMRSAKILESLPPEAIGSLDMPLSYRRLELLGDATPEQQSQTLADAAGDPEGAFAKLRQTLREMCDENMDEAEAPRRTPGTICERIMRRAETLGNWYAKNGLEHAARPHIEALVELAKQAIPTPAQAPPERAEPGDSSLSA